MKGKELILLVEDHERQAEKLANLINNNYSYYAIVAHNGYEAFDAIKKNRRFFGLLPNKIKCILLDLQMPKLSGEEFLYMLRKRERFNIFSKFMPVIVLTAYTDLVHWDKVTNPIFGMVAGYLNKPVNEKELFDMLHRVVFKNDAEYLIEETMRLSYKLHDELEGRR